MSLLGKVESITLTRVAMFESALPKDTHYSVLHLRTNAYQCKPLVISKKKPLTLKAKHLLLVTENASGCIVVGFEVFIYFTITDILERQIFILKADTTGLGYLRVSVAAIAKEFLAYLVAVDPAVYLSNVHLHSKKPTETPRLTTTSEFDLVNDLRLLSERVATEPQLYESMCSKASNKTRPTTSVAVPSKMTTRVSLFARSAHAYLFPESDKNPKKHVADGNALFKWWLRVLDAVLDDSWRKMADIPGADRAAVERFFPLAQWRNGNIFVSDGPSLAVHCIPLFPDDPKGRFLEHLIVENRFKAVNSRLFWDELGFRQEFRLGNVVGIIGCEVGPVAPEGRAEDSLVNCLDLREYKKLAGLIKGEDYSKREDIVQLWTSGLRGLAGRIGVDLRFESMTGTASEKAPKKPDSETVNVLNVRPVNDLSSMVKRKKTG